MAKQYQLISGFHSEHTYTPATQAEVDDDRIKTVFRRGGHYKPGTKSYVPGDIIESDEDLTKKFVNKFREVTKHSQVKNPWDDLDGKTSKQLKALAEAEEIDLGDASTKKEILVKLKQAVGLLPVDEPEELEAV